MSDSIQDHLHDLCQPLTALQCRLHLSTMHVPGSEQERTEMRSAIQDGLRLCERMMLNVKAMQLHMDEKH